MTELRIFVEERRGRYLVKPQKKDKEKWEDINEGVRSVAAARLFGNEIPAFTSTRIGRTKKRVKKWFELWREEHKIKAEITEEQLKRKRESKGQEKEKKKLLCKQCNKPILTKPTPFTGICTKCRMIEEIIASQQEDNNSDD